MQAINRCHTYGTPQFYSYIIATPQIYEILSILEAIQKLITVISYAWKNGGGDICCNYLTTPRVLTSTIYSQLIASFAVGSFR
jgi:hypothetical protein